MICHSFNQLKLLICLIIIISLGCNGNFALAENEQHDLHGEILKVFNTYIEKWDAFLEAYEGSTEAYAQLRRELEEYSEDELSTALRKLPSVLCSTPNRQLLTKFFDVLLRQDLNEEPFHVFAKIYLCNRDFVINTIKSLKDNGKKEKIIKVLELGLTLSGNENELSNLRDVLSNKS